MMKIEKIGLATLYLAKTTQRASAGGIANTQLPMMDAKARGLTCLNGLNTRICLPYFLHHLKSRGLGYGAATWFGIKAGLSVGAVTRKNAGSKPGS